MVRLRDRPAAASGGRLPDEGGAVVGAVLRRCSPGDVPAAKIGHYPDSANRPPCRPARAAPQGGGKEPGAIRGGRMRDMRWRCRWRCRWRERPAERGAGQNRCVTEQMQNGTEQRRTEAEQRRTGRNEAGARHQTRARLLRTQLLRTRARNSATGVRSLMHGARQPPGARLGREPSRTRRPPRKDSAFRTKRALHSGISPPERHFFGGLP